MAAHGVDDRPVLEDLQRDVAGVDILQGHVLERNKHFTSEDLISS